MTALSFHRTTPWIGAGPLGAVAVYLAAYAPLYSLFGANVTLLCLVPVAVVALDHGSRGALLAVVAIFPVNLSLRLAFGDPFIAGWFTTNDTVTWLMILIAGVVVGIHRDLSLKKQRDLEYQQVTNAELDEMMLKLAKIRHRLPTSRRPSRSITAICVHCMRVQDPQGDWRAFSAHDSINLDSRVVRSLCPHCENKLHQEN